MAENVNHTLFNGSISATINANGAELVSLKNRAPLVATTLRGNFVGRRLAPLPRVFPGLLLAGRALLYLETAAKLLKLLEGSFDRFSKCALKSFNIQTDFDSAIRRFDPSRPSHA